MADHNTPIITEFRENNGKMSGFFEGKPLLILHHTGRKSGKVTENPLMYMPEGDGYVVFGTMGGAPTRPAWAYNIEALPEVEIEVGTETGTETRQVHATLITDDERSEELYKRNADQWPQFWEYREKTDRKFPVFILEPR